MLTIVPATGTRTRVVVAPATRAIVSWNTGLASAALELIVHRADGRSSLALPYVAFEPGRRSSLDGFDDVAAIATDVVEAAVPIVAIDVCSEAALTRVAVATPPARDADAVPAPPAALDVAPLAQDDPGWCAPATIAMLLGYWGQAASVAAVALATYDAAYGGTGNWAFAVAHAGARGLLGVAAYLGGVATLERFIAAGLPLATSIAWEAGTLPGAPLARSAGHLVVVRGFDARGDVLVNDPAHPALRIAYPRAEFAQAWLGHGGAALIVAPAERTAAVLRCVPA